MVGDSPGPAADLGVPGEADGVHISCDVIQALQQQHSSTFSTHITVRQAVHISYL